jgi:hypothetical protein
VTRVSEQTQDLFMHLVAWECFGATEIEPKLLLRQVPLADLKIVSANVKAQGTALRNFACVTMVELELLFKSGLLQGDWGYDRNGDRVSLQYEPVSYPPQEVSTPLTDISSEGLIGAMA